LEETLALLRRAGGGPVEVVANVAGISTWGPIEDFERHAVSPEHVAEKTLAAVERDRYLVFTSADIRFAFLAQRWCPPAYEAAMRLLSDRLEAAAARSAAP
jgi:hypothetical protein